MSSPNDSCLDTVQMRKEREDRLRNQYSGSWGSSSAWYFRLGGEIFKCSAKDSSHVGWVYAGLPILLAGMEAFLIEHQQILRLDPLVKPVAGIDPLIEVLNAYPIPAQLRHEVEIAIEVRNEILHPSPKPFSTCPGFIAELQSAGVLDTRQVDSGTSLLALIGSHRFFQWAALRCQKVVQCVVESDDRKPMYAGLAANLDWVYQDNWKN